MNRCKRCGEVNIPAGDRHRVCAHCRYLAVKARPGHLKRMRDMMKRRYASRKRYIDDYKVEKGCFRCGENRLPCLDIHHVTAKKKHGRDVISAVGKHWSLTRLKRTLEGCQIVCANCHRLLHHEERVLGKDVSRTGKRSSRLPSMPPAPP